MEATARHYSWMDFNSVIRDCNISWVREFYANAVAYSEDDFTSTVRGVTVSYTPAVIDAACGFTPTEQCWARQWRHIAHTEEDYGQMLHTLALSGRDWQYISTGARTRLNITDMMPAARGWAKWLVRNFECASQETEIIMCRCHAIFAIMRREPIRVGDLIVRSIKRMIVSRDTVIGHPFVITMLCQAHRVPFYEDTDIIARPERPLGRVYFQRDVRDLEAAQAAAAPPPGPQHQEQHQPPPHAPQHRFSDYELGMAATTYVQYVRMDWGLPHFSLELMAAVEEYLGQTPVPSYNQLYPEQADLTGHFHRQTTRLLEHQTHVQDTWTERRQPHHPEPQYASDGEIDRMVDEVYDSLRPRTSTQFFSVGGSSSHQGQ
ncbi:hypothetical protein A2U01_0004596 [Trifolium medium]|uniref:Putative plant transposon protein domain-containing protein n=1 Tax=Trifolium medium TaxID=97028 RepID=A0A392M8F3_9FABA|nr:hypothetical protein [Trifolium medium]